MSRRSSLEARNRANLRAGLLPGAVRISSRGTTRKALRLESSRAKAEQRAEYARCYLPVLEFITERSRPLWTERLLERPDPGDPGTWRGRVSKNMRKDWAHAAKLLARKLAAGSLEAGSRFDTRPSSLETVEPMTWGPIESK